MRIVLCDEDPLIRDVVEAVVVKTGHEVVGIADSTGAAIGLIETARPDAVVVDLWLGFDSDYDLIQMALDLGARPIVFSTHGDEELTAYSFPLALVQARPGRPRAGPHPARCRRQSHHCRPRARVRPGRTAGLASSGIDDAAGVLRGGQRGEGRRRDHLHRPLAGGRRSPRRPRTSCGGATGCWPSRPRSGSLPGGGEEGVAQCSGGGGQQRGHPGAHRGLGGGRDGERGADAFDRLKTQRDPLALRGGGGGGGKGGGSVLSGRCGSRGACP